MNYTKPEVVLNVNASAVIKGTMDPQLKQGGPELDGNGVDRNTFIAAYEADE